MGIRQISQNAKGPPFSSDASSAKLRPDTAPQFPDHSSSFQLDAPTVRPVQPAPYSSNASSAVSQTPLSHPQIQARLLAKNFARQRQELKALESELQNLASDSQELQEEMLSWVEGLGRAFLEYSALTEEADHQEKLKKLATHSYEMLARVAAGSDLEEIQVKAAYYQGLANLIQNDLSGARFEFEKIRDFLPEADERLKLMERHRVRSNNLAALQTWASLVEEESFVRVEKSKGVAASFLWLFDHLIRPEGEGIDNDRAMRLDTERKVIRRLQTLILSGEFDTLNNALYYLSGSARHSKVKARAWELYQAAQPAAISVKGSDGIIPSLIQMTSGCPKDPKLARRLYETARQLADENLEFNLQSPLGIYAILHENTRDPQLKNQTLLQLEKAHLEKGFKDYLISFLQTTNPESLALEVTLMAGAAYVGGRVGLAALDKLRQSGTVGWKGLTAAKTAEIGAEGSALWALNTSKDLLLQDPQRILDPKHLAQSYGATLIMIAYLKGFGAAGESYAPRLARWFGLTQRATPQLSAAGRALAWAGGHGVGMGGMVASTHTSESLGLQQAPLGGWRESLVHDIFGYVRFAVVHRLVDGAAAGRLTKFSHQNVHEKVLITAQVKVEGELPKLGHPILKRKENGDPVFEDPSSQRLYEQLSYATLTRPGFSPAKLSRHMQKEKLQEAKAYGREFHLGLEIKNNRLTGIFHQAPPTEHPSKTQNNQKDLVPAPLVGAAAGLGIFLSTPEVLAAVENLNHGSEGDTATKLLMAAGVLGMAMKRKEAASKKTTTNEKTWNSSPEHLRATLIYIFENSLKGDQNKITAGPDFIHNKFPTPEGGLVSGRKILNMVAGFEYPGMARKKAINTLGGLAKVIGILKEKYLGLSRWDQDPETLKKSIEYILQNSLGGDPGKISTGYGFRNVKFSTPDGSKVSGEQLITAVAVLERPGMSRKEAVDDLGGAARVVEILKEKYLGISHWDQTPETLQNSSRFILKNSLGGDPEKISTGYGFRNAKFSTPDGSKVSGEQLISAVAGLERPGMSKKKAIKSMGGAAKVVEILKEKYLGVFVSHWDQNPENLKESLRYIFENSLGGDPRTISTAVSFLKNKFSTPDGSKVSGEQLITAVAGFERPGMSKKKAIKSLGGLAKVVEILKLKYLAVSVSTWNENPETLKESLRYIFQNSLGGDAGKISTGYGFRNAKFSTPDGTKVSGDQTIAAVAGFERPGMSKRKAIKSLGGLAKVVEILKKKYLGVFVSHWDQNPEILKESLRYIFENSLGGNPGKISTGFGFLRNKFPTPDGTKVSGRQIIAAVAKFERPETTKEKAIEDVGGPAKVIEILKEKYLGIQNLRAASPEAISQFIEQHDLKEILDLFPDSPAEAIQALAFLKGEELRHQDIREIVKAYQGLKVERGEETGGREKPEDSWEVQNRYLKALLQALDAGEGLDLSEENFKTQLRLLVNISRKSYEEDSGKLFRELRGKLEQSSHLFAKRLLQETIDYFQGKFHFEINGMQTTPFGYQREGAQFLATHPHAILADEAGLGKSYQAIAAVETMGLKRVLWVTTSANKETLREEILEHSLISPEQIGIVISGDPKGRNDQINSLNGEKYLITNYENLVKLKQDDPEAYHKLTRDLDLVIVDEAQLTDNPKALRTQAIHDIPSPRRWLLTASPYQNKPENLWTLLNWLEPENYPDKKAFLKIYTQNTQGLILLHSELSDILLRRSKHNTMGYFEPASGKSFAEQLADGIPRIPRFRRVPPSESGRYPLLPEQADLIARMVANFRGWAEEFNRDLPDGAEPVAVGGINPLMKFSYLHRVLYEPDYFGIKEENPVFAALDQSVARRLAVGEKIILWGFNESVIAGLTHRYEKLGVRKIDGTVLGESREQARRDFQEDPQVRILVANYTSGGVGLTLTAAHSAIFVQLPHHYPMLYQAEGRHQRLIGLKNVRHAKERVEVEWMIPAFPEDFVQKISDPQLKEILSHGTLVEQTRSRLEGGELLYNLLMEGMGNPKEIEEYFKKGLFEGMGLNRNEKIDYTSHLKGQTKSWAEVAQALLPLWRKVKGDGAGEERVLRLLAQLKNNPELAKRLGREVSRIEKIPQEDLEFVTGLFEIRNKFIRQQILAKVPDLMARVYARGKTLDQVSQGLKLGGLTPVSFVAQLYREAGIGGEVMNTLSHELAVLRDNPVKRYLEEHYFMGIFGIMGQAGAEHFLKNKGAILNEAPLKERIHLLYRLGLLARVRPELLEQMNGTSFDTWEGLAASMEEATYQALGDFAGRSPEAVREMVGSNPNWRGNADPLLALIAGFRNAGEMPLVEQMGEALSYLFAGQYLDWRYGENDRREGMGIEFLKEEKAFWEGYGRNDWTKLPQVDVSTQKIKQTLFRQYQSVMDEFSQDGPAVEGQWLAAELEKFREASKDKQQKILKNYRGELSQLGALLGRGETGPESQRLLGKYRLSMEDSLESKMDLREKTEELRNLIAWMELDRGFQSILKGQPVRAEQLARNLDLKVKYYRRKKFEKAAEHFEALRGSVQKWNSRSFTFKDVTIEDTDDPAILTRMGALHPEMINCFNPNGNPTFNQHVVAALGSKNMKMVVVREEGKIVAAAMVKVKELEDGRPVLFLETGLYRKGYDFREEMLAHLQLKAERMEPKPIVMEQLRSNPKDSDPWVYGTGAYTENEYVEPVFGLRHANSVHHRGRVFGKALGKIIPKPLDSEPFQVHADTMLMGLGTSIKSWEEYVGSLLERGVKVLVDVRARPQSRFRPHFNRKRMEQALAEQGIQYVWLGETLGNPKDATGHRTLKGFQAYMKTQRYQAGRRALQQIIQAAEGHVALTCAEGREVDCHRSFILEDFRTGK